MGNFKGMILSIQNGVFNCLKTERERDRQTETSKNSDEEKNTNETFWQVQCNFDSFEKVLYSLFTKTR